MEEKIIVGEQDINRLLQITFGNRIMPKSVTYAPKLVSFLQSSEWYS